MYILFGDDNGIARIKAQVFKIVGEDRVAHLMTYDCSVRAHYEHASPVRIAVGTSSHVQVLRDPGAVGIKKSLLIENSANHLYGFGGKRDHQLISVFQVNVRKRIQSHAVRIHLKHHSAGCAHLPNACDHLAI